MTLTGRSCEGTSARTRFILCTGPGVVLGRFGPSEPTTCAARDDRELGERPDGGLASFLVLVLASSEGVAGITAAATLAAAAGLAAVTVLTKRQDLAHNRELADLSDLRALLDEAAITIDAANGSFNEVADTPAMLWESDDRDRLRFIQQFLASLQENGRTMAAMGARLHVRLGPNDPIAIAYREAGRSLSEVASHIATIAGPFEKATLQAWFGRLDELKGDFSEAANIFIVAAVERAGTVATRGGG
jgi:hypothetical protein